jgi:hypothetical protein
MTHTHTHTPTHSPTHLSTRPWHIVFVPVFGCLRSRRLINEIKVSSSFALRFGPAFGSVTAMALDKQAQKQSATQENNMQQ